MGESRVSGKPTLTENQAAGCGEASGRWQVANQGWFWASSEDGAGVGGATPRKPGAS